MIAVVIGGVLCAALGALGVLGVLVVLGAGKLGRRDDVMAVADATRECATCLGWSRAPCTCKGLCPSICCTAWDDAIPPTPPRIVPDIKEST